MLTPNWSRMKPSPIRFVGVPIGVAKPPIEAAKAMQRKSPVANRGSSRRSLSREASSTAPRIPATIATIIAAVTVLEMNALISTDTTATAVRMRVGRPPTQGTASTPKASRRSSL